MLSALIVEDEEMVRELLSAQLQKLGFEVSCAVDGEKGLAILKSGQRFDIVFLDVVMPKINGLALVKSIRELDNLVRYVPVFMITGNSDKNLVVKAVGLGATDFLIKPWSSEDLVHKVKAALPPPLNYEEIKSVIARLHVEEKDMLRSQGLTDFSFSDYKSFAVTLGKNRFCFIVKRGIKVSEIAALPITETPDWLTIFVRRNNRWQYCWPGATV